MTTSSNPEAGSEDQEDRRPRDWRRRRRSDRPPPEAAERTATSRPQGENSDEVLSQPLIEFFEPALDQIATYSAPLIFAGIIGLFTG